MRTARASGTDPPIFLLTIRLELLTESRLQPRAARRLEQRAVLKDYCIDEAPMFHATRAEGRKHRRLNLELVLLAETGTVLRLLVEAEPICDIVIGRLLRIIGVDEELAASANHC